MKRLTIFSIMVLATTLLSPAPAYPVSTITLVSASASGSYPTGTSFFGTPIQGLNVSTGVEVGPTGTALGQLTISLIGPTILGVERDILIEASANAGTPTAPNVAVFTGTCSVDMGDGTPPLTGVTFNATVTTDGTGTGTIAVVVGSASLPVTSLDGTVDIRLR